MKNKLKLIALLIFITNIAFSQKTFIDKTNAYLSELSKDENFGLSISISKNDDVLLEKAYGFASREHQVPNKANTTFNIASIGKLFTAVSILQLREQGKIDLQKTVGNYLLDFPNKDIANTVTIHQLLTHTSGLPLWLGESFDEKPKFDYLELADYLPSYETMKIDSTKIGNNNYSNAGFVLLGFVIEAVAKMPYKDYLNEHIFKPLKMNDTNIWKLTEIIPNVATGYIRPSNRQDWWKTNYHLNMGSNPAGGAFASPRDLLKFYNGLLNNKLLTKASTELMLSPKVKTGYGEYGYGIAITNKNEKEITGHLGGYYGTRGELMWYKADNYIISILANSDQTDYMDVSHFIKTQLAGTPSEKKAYQNTLEYLNADDFKKLSSHHALESISFDPPNFDEMLIQIKGYYHLNNQAYDLARKLFYLNSVLFPDSQSAKRDLERVEGYFKE